ncbi:alpha/beta hydrolase domain-containing protein [Phenylobacterium sp.]|jgi:hypothetical protein|uniref:alpha/beta hydrolase domain-containing protein n=1 Tax=Phenylobacterium sp. TaxID=1871053 RepID=UPI002F41A0C9
MRGLRGALAALAGLVVSLTVAVAGGATAAPGSRITAVEISDVAPAGAFKGVSYVRVKGVVHGAVAPGEDVVGLAALPKAPDGRYAWSSAFELIAPAAGQPANEVVYVDSENRGSPVSLSALSGFLQAHATSYAHVQWQAGISPGVPTAAQGVGLVVMRDFARWLAGRTPDAAVSGPKDAEGWKLAPYRKLILGGISQSAWLVDDVIAEGFNVDPATKTRVFDAAIAVDGVGEWLAINRLAADRGAQPRPYVDPHGVPLSRQQLLKRPNTDPVYVDIANFTDFYRLRAGLTSTDYSAPGFRRYDFPSPHAVGNPQRAGRCNGGQPLTFNTVRYAPYMRALVLGLEQAIGVAAARDAHPLPPSRVFALGPAPQGVAWFNPLPGVTVKTPVLDADGWPKGGVRFPEADAPLGRPFPPSVSPVDTTSIDNTCGNLGGFQPFDRAARAAHGLSDADAYVRRYSASLDRLVAEGFLLREDTPAMLEAARTAYARP